jgi:hypothetical protein
MTFSDTGQCREKGGDTAICGRPMGVAGAEILVTTTPGLKAFMRTTSREEAGEAWLR